MSVMEIAIFGTSADPPTSAHRLILDFLNQKFNLVAVYASDNPFKTHSCDLYHRNQMLSLLIGESELLSVQLVPEISALRTIHSVEKAKQKWGENTTITVVIGSDLIPQIFSWYEAQKLWTQVKILIIPRQGYQPTPEVINQLNQYDYEIADFVMPSISSTDYREAKNEQVLTPAINNYIKNHHLYHNVG